MIRCNMCMATYLDYDVTDCPACETDSYMMEVSNTVWAKYDYVCTNCDALVEVTAQVMPVIDPDCVCGNGMIINIGTSPAFAPIITDVSNITPTNVVKINTNPYN